MTADSAINDVQILRTQQLSVIEISKIILYPSLQVSLILRTIVSPINLGLNKIEL